jgi:hypothetical protein
LTALKATDHVPSHIIFSIEDFTGQGNRLIHGYILFMPGPAGELRGERLEAKAALGY